MLQGWFMVCNSVSFLIIEGKVFRVVSGISHNLCVILQLDILSKFEGRIHKLEDTIVPVHRETDDLQRRQASILNL